MEKIYCCQEDYDMAIDDFIMDQETFPVMEEDKDHKCQYCDEPSAYVIMKKGLDDLEQ